MLLCCYYNLPHLIWIASDSCLIKAGPQAITCSGVLLAGVSKELSVSLCPRLDESWERL
jgi:hypothetical protein